MTLRLRVGIAVAMAVAFTFAGRAQAATITFTSSTAFLAALPYGTFIETYDSYPANLLIGNGDTLNGITYTFPLPSFDYPSGTVGRIDNVFGNFGGQSLALSRPDIADGAGDFFFPGESMTISFANPISAFGIFFNAALSPAGSFQIATSAGTATSAADHDISTFYFVGLISDTPFSSATIRSTGTAASGYVLDHLIIGTPEPATLGLLGAGLAVLAARRRKARQHKHS